MEQAEIRVTIKILENDGEENEFTVGMLAVPRKGDRLRINGETSGREQRSKVVEQNEGIRILQVESVCWSVTRMLDKKSGDHRHGFVEIVCRQAD